MKIFVTKKIDTELISMYRKEQFYYMNTFPHNLRIKKREDNPVEYFFLVMLL